jgi:ParB/RepB/Spo0J family partition protein
MGHPKKVVKVETGTAVKETPKGGEPANINGKVTPKELDETFEKAKRLIQEGSTPKVEPANVVHEVTTEAPAEDVKAPDAPVIEKERFRKDLGDLTELKKSIKEIGQIHPIVIDSKGTLIAGKRRLQSCIELGIEPVYRTVDFTDPEQAEIDENTLRKDFTPSEIFAINKYYNEKLSKQGSSTDINSGANDTEVKKQPRDVVSNVTGVGTKTLSKINKIYNSDNEELKEKIDKGKLSIDSGYNKLKKTEKPDKKTEKPDKKKSKKVFEADLLYTMPMVEKDVFELIRYSRAEVLELQKEITPENKDEIQKQIDEIQKDFKDAFFELVKPDPDEIITEPTKKVEIEAE